MAVAVGRRRLRLAPAPPKSCSIQQKVQGIEAAHVHEFRSAPDAVRSGETRNGSAFLGRVPLFVFTLGTVTQPGGPAAQCDRGRAWTGTERVASDGRLRRQRALPVRSTGAAGRATSGG